MDRRIKLHYPDGTLAGYAVYDGSSTKVYQIDEGRKKLLFQVRGIFPPPTVDYSWIDKVLEKGLGDGRKRFILYVASRYLVNVKSMDEETALDVLRKFYEIGGGVVYDAWLRSVIRGVKSRGLKPWSLSRVKRDDPDLFSQIQSVLSLGPRAKSREST
ncbi:hypothetical protein HS1genome_0777 [Sulfodiicoccus acidiphilus]|uniref:Primase X domain-containing protein n=1 Tax=Sulfodiicoccus acidiphilus TaxID=1670455 RepID=A0A348B2I6_9CREN|nr:DNA primase noncatalytic subunit PriX [Sulfodiicoccus acidiphilus]BBD72388.1 hypothetical protein HS1genome_0777 [Sulfodiicoccus acidiphilus]GGT97472.1 hypothetical protein GCM10007116_13780 [Sulfodiicoccus acidiphilus]